MNFNLIATAGLMQHEFAALAGVSRVTVNLWVKGKMMPHRYIRMDTENLLDGIAAAIESNQLPIAKGVSKHLRMGAIREVVASMAQPQ
jgi:DNA-binding XRE family transcriptional regulator